MSKVLFKSFSSGSCGNCYLLAIREDDGSIGAGVLIDAGVSLKRLRSELRAEGLTTNDFDAVLVTHDHMDHIRSLSSYCKHLSKPVWGSKALLQALSRHSITANWISSCQKVIPEGEWIDVAKGKISVRHFTVPHDASATSGFAICLAGHFYVHITDCGKMTEEALALCSQADSVVLESNYDDRMLEEGPYPKELKERIRRGSGHLSKAHCAEAIKAFAHPGLRNLFLCHLSENNNTPKKAWDSAKAALDEALPQAQVRLQTLPRQSASALIIL